MNPHCVFAQLISGKVIDKVSKSPIAGATICCYPDSVLCSSDSLGNFIFSGVKHNRIDLVVHFMGYESAYMSQILATSSKDLSLIIELNEQINELNEITISARHPKLLTRNDMSLTSARTFSVEECRRYAGGLDDPARMVSNFAGCSAVTPESNAIIVRGNSPLGVLWRLEGIEIPSPVHFNGSGDLPGGGLYTIFSSFMLANSDFYSGCFPSEFFNAIGGIFDMKFRSGNQLKHEYSAQLGIQGIELSAEGPLSRSHQSAFICNARVSTMQFINSIIPDLSKRQAVNYSDCATKVDLPSTKIGNLSIWSILGFSKLTRTAKDDTSSWVSPAESSDVAMKNMMSASGITYEKSFGNQISMKNVLAFTNENRQITYGLRNPRFPEIHNTDYEFQNKCFNIVASSIWNHKLSNKIIGRYGLTYKHIWDQCMYNIKSFPLCDYQNTASLINGHVQFKHRISNNISTLFGGNLTYFSLINDYSIEPRIGFEYKQNTTHSIALGGSIHSQIAPLYIYDINIPDTNVAAAPNRNLKMMKALHITSSYNWVTTSVSRIKIEPYIQYLYDVPVMEGSTLSIINLTTNPPLLSNRFVNTGAGMNIGCDITFERFLAKGYYYMGTFSIFKSAYRDFFNNWHPSMFDARWFANILGGKEFVFKRSNGLSKILGLNAHISVSGHTPTSPVNYDDSYISKCLVYDDTKPYSCRKKGINILSDISLTYIVNYKLFSGTIALQVKNFFGRQYLGKFFNLATDRVEDLYFTSPIPLLSYKIDF